MVFNLFILKHISKQETINLYDMRLIQAMLQEKATSNKYTGPVYKSVHFSLAS